MSKTKKPPAEITIEDLEFSGEYKKSNARVLQIVQVAAELFHQKGYGPTTTRDIGEACGISPGHLYYYIKSKDVLPSIFRKIHDKDMRNWDKSIRNEMKRLPPEKLLRKAVRDYTHIVHLRRKLIAFWYHAQTQIKREDQLGILASEKRVEDLFREIIELGNKIGQFHVRDPFILSFNILMMCQNWALRRWLVRDSRTIDQYVDVIEELVIVMAKGVPAQGPQKVNRVLATRQLRKRSAGS